ncbi:MAG TPA: MaoC family dehydratase [Aliidongia sp.]|nr:MaoC family dehydratase [Aliidongia sp.]
MSITYGTIRESVGKLVGISDWITIDQARINQFADCTGDHQWIHVDVERAKQGPFGATIAHGFLTLSLIPQMGSCVWAEPSGISAAFNYGLNRVRFASPVRSGSRVRDHVTLAAIEEREGGGILVTMEHRVEIEGEDKPALVATTLALIMG